MINYLFKRVLLLLPTLYVVVTLVFFLLRLIPGDPVDFILGDNALPQSRADLVAAHHFDEPVLSQYSHYLGAVMHGDLGHSYFSDKSVNQQIAERYPATLQLAATALLWAILISFPLGLLAAVRSGEWSDRSIMTFTLLGISVPGFYLGPLLALLFSIRLDWVPLSGRELPGSVILPSLTLGLAMAALLTRLVRTTMLDVLRKEYVRTARAKGVHPVLVVVQHAFRTALIPVVAVLGLQMGTLLTGAVVTEKIFSWPGLGSLMLEAITRRDYAVVQGCVLLIAAVYAVVNLATDLIYSWLDPRVRLS